MYIYIYTCIVFCVLTKQKHIVGETVVKSPYAT